MTQRMLKHGIFELSARGDDAKSLLAAPVKSISAIDYSRAERNIVISIDRASKQPRFPTKKRKSTDCNEHLTSGSCQSRKNMSKLLSWARNLSREQRRIWAIGTGVVVLGTGFKTSYFMFSRGLIVDDRDEIHRKATEHLKEASVFAEWAHEDREARAPPLTPEQEEQLRNYLAFVAENSPVVFPKHGEGKELQDMHKARQRDCCDG